jgi:hypothetical protein
MKVRVEGREAVRRLHQDTFLKFINRVCFLKIQPVIQQLRSIVAIFFRKVEEDDEMAGQYAGHLQVLSCRAKVSDVQASGEQPEGLGGRTAINAAFSRVGRLLSRSDGNNPKRTMNAEAIMGA